MSSPEQVSRTYRFAMRACTPIVGWWGRLEVEGLEHIPESGPVLLAGNHDSYWDPVAVGIAGLQHRQVCALAKSSLWKIPGLRQILNGMGQIPIERGVGDVGALDSATTALREGACIGIFPEGTTTRGTELRARSGVGRLAQNVPEAQILSCTIERTVDIARFPRRPRIRVVFFPPAGGGLQPGESGKDFAQRLLDEIRERAPRATAGRKGR